MIKSRKAQSTLEYILVFTAIIGAVIVAANSIIKPKVNNMLDHVATQAETAVEHINFK
jgi:uncharacterized protein (UPF0333 family)